MASLLKVPDYFSDKIKKLLQEINDSITFDEEPEEVGESISPDIEKYPLIVKINPRINKTLEELAKLSDERLIPLILSPFDYHPYTPLRYHIHFENYSDNIASYLISGESDSLWEELPKQMVKTAKEIARNAKIPQEELKERYPKFYLTP